ncbi:glycosyltransferase family 2 protein [Patescibacteria group bacterium]|nr:glycosyltransferase family 2 protein [Patescibacteria group bacterium]
MKKLSLDLVIPSYNAKYLLEENLPKVIKYSPEINKIIVVDDGGSDDTKKYLKQNIKNSVYLKNNNNLGFPKSVNKGFKASKADLVLLLNNDVYSTKPYLDKAIKHFQDPNIFAVTLNEKNSSWPKVAWKNGKFQYTQGKNKTKPRHTPWASGGSAIFKKSIWDKLGGLNEIYSPGYWEDIDIGWRAWKQGYKIIWEPNSKVIHQHQSSFNKLNQNWLNLIKQRNELLFIWQNFSNPKFILSHLWFLFSYTLTHPGFFKVIWAAIKSLPRARRIKNAKLSDSRVLEIANNLL